MVIKLVSILLLLSPYLINGKEIPQQVEPSSRSCTSIDYRSELPPIRNQGSIGWCYAFSAADLVSHKLQQNISPVDIALSFNNSLNQNTVARTTRDTARLISRYMGLETGEQKNPPTPASIREHFLSNFTPESQRESGWVDQSIMATQARGGFCLDAPISGLAENNDEFISVIAMMERMRNGYSLSLEKTPDLDVAEFVCNYGSIPESLTDPISTIGLERITQYLEGRLIGDLFYGLVNEQCQNRISASFEAQEINLNPLSTEEKLQTINQILENGSILSINFMSQMLTGPDTPGEYHAAPIVGRRQNTENQQCEYLVRNSWGPSCEAYTTNECEGGYVWVSESDIVEHAQQLNHL